jgi:hypothetical protein
MWKYYLVTTTLMTFDVAALVSVPANPQVIEQVPIESIFTVARVKMPPVRSSDSTVSTLHTDGVEVTALMRCPILSSPEFCPLVKRSEDVKK